MAKLFISFLGTGDYKECCYRIGENQYKTKFIQECLIENISKDSNLEWNEEDRICIFETEDSKNKHHIELENILKRFNLKIDYVNIPKGKDQKELWELFSKIYDKIQDKDEIYLDITHAFRYIPMFSSYILNLAKIQKHCEIKRINYGAYEAKNKDEITNEEYAPVFDFVIFDELSDWSLAFDSFKNYGSAEKLKKIVTKDNMQLKEEKKVNELVMLLDKFTQSLQLCSKREVIDLMKKVKNEIDNIKKEKLSSPEYKLKYDVVLSLEEMFKNFESSSESKKYILLARWCADHNWYAQAITIANEVTYGYILNLLKDNHIEIPGESLKDKSQNVSCVVSIFVGSNNSEDFKKNHNEYFEQCSDFFNTHQEIPYKKCDELRDIRNSINHFKDQNKSQYSNMKKKIDDYINRMLVVLDNK